MRLIAFVLFFLTVIFTSPVKAADGLSLLSYNLGLAYTFVPYAKERRDPLLETLAKSQADVICLQEVWKKSDREAIKKALSKSHPYFTDIDENQISTKHSPTCKYGQLFGEGKFGKCLVSDCLEKKGDAFTECVIDVCGPKLEILKKENQLCATALMSLVGKNVAVGILSLLNPLWGANLYAYDGSAGLVLLSKYPLENIGKVELQDIATINHRSAITAEINQNGKKHRLLCTHLTADLAPEIPYTGSFASWEAENRQQVKRILDQVDKGDNTPLYLLGDFNCSLASKDGKVANQFHKSCLDFHARGFQDPAHSAQIGCTFCGENSLIGSESVSHTIDHIFVKNAKVEKVEKVYTEKIEAYTEQGKIKTNLSDHFGVLIKTN